MKTHKMFKKNIKKAINRTKLQKGSYFKREPHVANKFLIQHRNVTGV